MQYPPETQGKMEGVLNVIFKKPKSDCPDFWIRFPKHNWPKSWSSMEDPSRSSRKESVRSSSGRTIMGQGNLRKFHWNTIENRFLNWDCLFVNRAKGLFLSVHVDDISSGRQNRMGMKPL